jgi:hypothetical protein
VDLHQLAQEVKKWAPSEMICTIAIVLALFVPGTLMLLCFREDLLKDLPVFLCLVLCVALSAPVCFLNVWLVFSITKLESDPPISNLSTFVSFLVHMVLCPVVLAAEVFDWSFGTFTLIVLCWQILLWAVLHKLVENWRADDRRKSKE